MPPRIQHNEPENIVTTAELNAELAAHRQRVVADVNDILEQHEERTKIALGSHGLRIEDAEKRLREIAATAAANNEAVSKLLILVRGDRDYGVTGLIEDQKRTAEFIADIKAKSEQAKGAAWVMRSLYFIASALGATAIIKLLDFFVK